MYADTEVSSLPSSVHEPGGASRVAILTLLCALGPETVHRCDTVDVQSAQENAPLPSGTGRIAWIAMSALWVVGNSLYTEHAFFLSIFDTLHDMQSVIFAVLRRCP